jgi:hypothetical protein
MSSPRLEEFFKTYEWLRDCLKVTKRAINEGNTRLLDDTAFMGQSQTQAADWIDDASKAADDFAVVALWAWFERYLIEFTQAKASVIASSSPAEFAQRLQARVTQVIEYWRPDDLLDLFKAITDANQIGTAKQIKDYRDWIAHRNPRRPAPAQTEPANAYSLFLAIIDAVERVSPVEQP